MAEDNIIDVLAEADDAHGAHVYVPEGLEGYHEFHDALNCFTWLIKARYASRDALKRRRFHLDHLWQGYLEQQVRSIGRARRSLTSSPVNAVAAESALRKVWYNELAFTTPQCVDPMLLDSKGVSRNMNSANSRHVFASWRIAEAYYTTYFALQTMLELRGSAYRRPEHNSTHRVFKFSVSDALRGGLLGFPFDLAGHERGARWSLAKLPAEARYLRHLYAAHPRYRWTNGDGSFEGTVRRVLRYLSRRAGDESNDKVMMPDLLKAMRVWANYTDINTLLLLRDGGYRAYLDQDLHIVTFFYAGIAEVGALAVLGIERTLDLATDFVESFINQHLQLHGAPAPHSLDVRFRVYQHLGWLEGRTWSPPSAPLAYTAPVPIPRPPV